MEQVQPHPKLNQMASAAHFITHVRISEPIPMESHMGGYTADISQSDLEGRMLAYRLYRGHDISTVCDLLLEML